MKTTANEFVCCSTAKLRGDIRHFLRSECKELDINATITRETSETTGLPMVGIEVAYIGLKQRKLAERDAKFLATIGRAYRQGNYNGIVYS